MKSSVLKPITAGITLAVMIFFMPFILAGAMMITLFTFIFFRLFAARRMRRAFTGRMRHSGDAGNQVIYLSPILNK
jgi:hypothetical protein